MPQNQDKKKSTAFTDPLKRRRTREKLGEFFGPRPDSIGTKIRNFFGIDLNEGKKKKKKRRKK